MQTSSLPRKAVEAVFIRLYFQSLLSSVLKGSPAWALMPGAECCVPADTAVLEPSAPSVCLGMKAGCDAAALGSAHLPLLSFFPFVFVLRFPN